MQFDEYITSRLTEHELNIVKLVVQGYSNEEIAQKIIFSHYSVKYHLSHIFKKIGAINRNNMAYIVGKHVIHP